MINSTGKVRVFINEVDYSDFLVEGSITDDSAYTNTIITSSGSMKLAGSSSVLDFNKNAFPIGSHVSIFVTLSNGNLAKLPRGSLLILGSSIDMKEPSITFELGCTLKYLTAREANYESEIEDLIETFVPQNIKDSFAIEEKNLTALTNLLDIAGLVIFQNSAGTIQKAKRFGNDGLGGNVDDAKLVSFDKFTTIDVNTIGGSIEELPSSILVKANTEIQKFSDEDDDDIVNGKPPPFIKSTTSRTILIPDANISNSDFTPRNITNTGDAQAELVPGCPIPFSNESDSGDVKYALTLTGSVSAIEKEYKETVTRGGFTSYEGPGNQVDFEYDFEYCSAGTYAGSLLNSLLQKYVASFNNEKQICNSFCGKANQAAAQTESYGGLKSVTPTVLPETDPAGSASSYAENIAFELNNTNKFFGPIKHETYHDYYYCLTQQYVKAAFGVAEGAKLLANKAVEAVDDYLKSYGYSNYNVTHYTYNKDDTLEQKVTNNYIHPAATEAASEQLRKIGYVKDNYNIDDLPYFAATGQFLYSGYQVYGQNFAQTVSGDNLISGHTPAALNPARRGGVGRGLLSTIPATSGRSLNLNLVLAQTTITTYFYNDLYTTEVIEVFDHQNPTNNYKQTNYSSTGSKNPAEPDRIEIKRDADGNIYSSAVETETIELEYDQTITLTGAPTNVVSSWLGQPGPQQKVINLPLDFAPIVRKYQQDGTPISFNPQTVLNGYNQILESYAENEAMKIAADNSGFRITESGTRAELFGYHPYYPIALNVSSLGKRYGLKAASSSWAFDRDNVLCSIDCFRTSEITSSFDQDEISPYIYTAITKVEAVSTIAPSTLNLPPTAANIEIVTIPQEGTLTLNGSPVSVGDVISVNDIQSGNVVFTPPSNDTSQVSISFEVLDTNGDQVGSGDNIFPIDQYPFADAYYADAGEFTDNTTNAGFPAGGGDFDLGTRPGGNYNLNGGDFDTGLKVQNTEPLPSSTANSQNGADNVEDDYGSSVVDQNGTEISTTQLPGPAGDNESLLQIELDFKFKTFSFLSITSEVIEQLGWDYGFILASSGTPIDNGTVTTPINYNLDFGTVTAPVEPALSSSVS